MAKSNRPKYLVASVLDMDEIMRAGFEKRMLEKRAESKRARERRQMIGKPLNLVDKKNAPIMFDDVLHNGSDYYRIYLRNGAVEMLSCTKGYLHDVKQEDLNDFQRVGPFKGNEKLFDCD